MIYEFAESIYKKTYAKKAWRWFTIEIFWFVSKYSKRYVISEVDQLLIVLDFAKWQCITLKCELNASVHFEACLMSCNLFEIDKIKQSY